MFLILYIIHRKFQDKNLLLGSFVSATFYGIVYINFSWLLFYLDFFPSLGYFLFALISGITAGFFTEDIRRGVLSGTIGVILAMALIYPNIYFIIFVFGIYFPYQTLPNILGGVIGGVLGSQIRRSYNFRKKTIIKPQLN
ncbi:MAG: hypothetical protein JSV62_05170 [Promethearchaeota archaeon]|nr:MAG: hypothetical protein JSV62_05170 [Candidatus Lokiarchaeota archaeon]